MVLSASTCSGKWPTMISALSRMACSLLTTYRRSFLLAHLMTTWPS
jgi:hypothetical protein